MARINTKRTSQAADTRTAQTQRPMPLSPEQESAIADLIRRGFVSTLETAGVTMSSLSLANQVKLVSPPLAVSDFAEKKDTPPPELVSSINRIKDLNLLLNSICTVLQSTAAALTGQHYGVMAIGKPFEDQGHLGELANGVQEAFVTAEYISQITSHLQGVVGK